MNFAPTMDRIAPLALPLVAARSQLQTPSQRPATTPPIKNLLQARGRSRGDDRMSCCLLGRMKSG
ncbi:MAG: hypothetical protein EBY32_19395 [Proteobacteria bacterium]|nr:hypothetical protein [Pseudomonadota bacterium]